MWLYWLRDAFALTKDKNMYANKDNNLISIMISVRYEMVHSQMHLDVCFTGYSFIWSMISDHVLYISAFCSKQGSNCEYKER